MVFIFLLLQVPDPDTTKIPAMEKLAQLDFYGTGLLMPGTICLLLALQWGGLTYAVRPGPSILYSLLRVLTMRYC